MHMRAGGASGGGERRAVMVMVDQAASGAHHQRGGASCRVPGPLLQRAGRGCSAWRRETAACVGRPAARGPAGACMVPRRLRECAAGVGSVRDGQNGAWGQGDLALMHGEPGSACPRHFAGQSARPQVHLDTAGPGVRAMGAPAQPRCDCRAAPPPSAAPSPLCRLSPHSASWRSIFAACGSCMQQHLGRVQEADGGRVAHAGESVGRRAEG